MSVLSRHLLNKLSVRASRFDISIPFWVTAFAIAAWSAAAAWINPAQFADSLEQFAWAHGVELGYWKHPPLPTWLIIAPIRLIGFSIYWTYALAATCFAGTAFFTWLITQRLFGQQAAVFAVLLIGLHIGFSWRAQLYNHNTVLILCVAATVWATLRALDSGKKTSWFLVGMLAGLAMLSKYQALVPLLGIVLTLQLGGWLKQRAVWQGVCVAMVAAFLVFSPHLIWMALGSGSTIDNAFNAAQGLSFTKRLTVFFGFWLIQIRFHLPILIAVALLVLFRKNAPEIALSGSDTETPCKQQTRAWFVGLVVWPAFFVSMAVLLGGMRLEAQWGLQTFQFVVVFIAWQLAMALPHSDLKRTILVVVFAQLLLAAFFTWSILQPQQQFWQGARSRNFPALAVSKEITAKWYEATTCPLKFVVGPSFEAVIVAAYSSSNPAVVEDSDFKKSPWVNAENLQTSGALYLATDAAKLPSGLSKSGQLVIPARLNDYQPTKQLFWGVMLPPTDCKPALQ